MTETELIDRLREAIVLDGPDVWRTNGYLQDAQQAGLSLADALKRANEVGQEVANNQLLYQNIQARIARLAQPSRSHLIDQDLTQIINAASSLKLSPDFVRNLWVPAVLQRLVAESTPPKPQAEPIPPKPEPVDVRTDNADSIEKLIEPEPAKPTVVVEPVVPEPIAPTPALPPVIAVERPTTKPASVPEPEPVVRSFTASPARIHKGETVTLSWDVENLLAVTIDDLGAGLSPQNRGWVKPTKTTDYTLFDANNNPLSTVRIEVIPPDRSGIYGVLFALGLLALIYWFVKRNNAPEKEPKSRHKTEQTSSTSSFKPSATRTSSRQPSEDAAENRTTTDSETAEVVPEPAKATDEGVTDKTGSEKSTSKASEEKPTPSEPPRRTTSQADARMSKYAEAFGDKPYDKVELGTDEYGWRRARSHGRWGYINENDEWMIQPEYEAVTPFRGNTASVFLNGQLMTINRSGEQVRN